MSEVRFDEDGVHVPGGFLRKARFVPWDALHEVQRWGSKSVRLGFRREPDGFERIEASSPSETTTALVEQWHAREVDEVVATGRFVGRRIRDREWVILMALGVPLAVVGLGMGPWGAAVLTARLPDLWASLPAHDRPGMLVFGVSALVGLQFLWIIGVCIAWAGWSERRRNRAWHRFVIDRDGIERVDADGRRALTPWARVRPAGGGWQVDDMILPLVRISGGRVPWLLLRGMTAGSTRDEVSLVSDSLRSIFLGAFAVLGVLLAARFVTDGMPVDMLVILVGSFAFIGLTWAFVLRPAIRREKRRFDAEAIALVRRLGWRADTEEPTENDEDGDLREWRPVSGAGESSPRDVAKRGT